MSKRCVLTKFFTFFFKHLFYPIGPILARFEPNWTISENIKIKKNVADARATTSTTARRVHAFQINTKITIRLCLITFFFPLNFLFSRTENLFGNSKQTKDKNKFQISI